MIQMIDDDCCFVCGKDNPVGLKAEFIVNTELRKAETTVKIPEIFQGWQGITHGGIISALLDEICAQACMASGLQIVTRELKICFKSPLPTGSTVKVFGEVIGERRRIIDTKGRIELDGKIVAEADVTMFMI